MHPDDSGVPSQLGAEIAHVNHSSAFICCLDPGLQAPAITRGVLLWTLRATKPGNPHWRQQVSSGMAQMITSTLILWALASWYVMVVWNNACAHGFPESCRLLERCPSFLFLFLPFLFSCRYAKGERLSGVVLLWLCGDRMVRRGLHRRQY